jgi:hypothetical protein
LTAKHAAAAAAPRRGRTEHGASGRDHGNSPRACKSQALWPYEDRACRQTNLCARPFLGLFKCRRTHPYPEISHKPRRLELWFPTILILSRARSPCKSVGCCLCILGYADRHDFTSDPASWTAHLVSVRGRTRVRKQSARWSPQHLGPTIFSAFCPPSSRLKPFYPFAASASDGVDRRCSRYSVDLKPICI